MNRQSALQAEHSIPAAPLLAGGILQRKCACGRHTIAGGACDECNRKKGSLQRATRNPELETQKHDGVPPIVHEVLRSPGQALDPTTRAFFEPRFGHDFSRVRVHADSKAAASAQAVNALAYTVGRDVVFGAGQYSPVTMNSRSLLAHELTHVVQQNAVNENREAPLQIGPAHDSFESQADDVSQKIRQVGPAKTFGSAGKLSLQRDLARPPRGPADPLRVLTPAEILAAIVFNEQRFSDPYSIRVIRDVVGIAATPAIVDEELVNSIVEWQAERNMTQDGQIGHATTRSIFLELVSAGDLRDAVFLLMDSYALPESRHLRSLRVGLGAGCCSTPLVANADAVTAGVGGGDATICVCRTSVPRGAGTYDHFVRILLHELTHVPQPAAGIGPGSHEGEFEAFFVETCRGGRAPRLSPAQRIDHANIAIDHFNAMNAALQTAARIDMRDRLNRLIAAGGVGAC